MTPAEQIGAELVMLIRREDELLRQLEDTRMQIDAIIKEVRTADSAIYKRRVDWDTQVIRRIE